MVTTVSHKTRRRVLRGVTHAPILRLCVLPLRTIHASLGFLRFWCFLPFVTGARA
jgi:hypothetical protein